MNQFFFNKTSQQKAKMNPFTVLESRNRLSTIPHPNTKFKAFHDPFPLRVDDVTYGWLPSLYYLFLVSLPTSSAAERVRIVPPCPFVQRAISACVCIWLRSGYLLAVVAYCDPNDSLLRSVRTPQCPHTSIGRSLVATVFSWPQSRGSIQFNLNRLFNRVL